MISFLAVHVRRVRSLIHFLPQHKDENLKGTAKSSSTPMMPTETTKGENHSQKHKHILAPSRLFDQEYSSIATATVKYRIFRNFNSAFLRNGSSKVNC
jgi:hypothetical protein